jgi:hypothetical protein
VVVVAGAGMRIGGGLVGGGLVGVASVGVALVGVASVGVASAGWGEAVAARGLLIGQKGFVEAVAETVVALEHDVAAVESEEKEAEREVGGDHENDDDGLRSGSRSTSKEK